jgi:hypothetical protein
LAGGWTNAGSPDTMRGMDYPSSCQGTGHVILATPSPIVRLVGHDRWRPRCSLGATTAGPVRGSAVRPRPPHRHVLVPRRRHQRRIPPRLQRRGGRRPPQRRPGLPPAGLCPQTTHALGAGRPPALRTGRHAHAALRPVRARRRHPPQPQPRTGRRAVRLRPRLGDPGLGGPALVVEHPVLAAARPALRPPQGRAPAGSGVPLEVPHQAGTGCRAGPLAGGVAGAHGQGAVGRGRRRLRQAAVPAPRTGARLHRGHWGSWCSAGCARTPT